MKTILQEHDGYRLSLKISRVPLTPHLYEVKFIKEYPLDERFDSEEKHYLTKEVIALLQSSLNVDDLCKPKCEKCGFINNMDREPPVIICSSCGEPLAK